MAIVAKVGQSPLNAMNAFPHGQFGQPDKDCLGQTRGGVHLGLDRNRVDPDEGECVQLGEHRLTGSRQNEE